MRTPRAFAAGVVAVLACTAVGDTVRTIDLHERGGAVLAVTDDEVRIDADGKEITIAREDAWRVELGEARALGARAGQGVIELAGGDRISVDGADFSLTDGRLNFLSDAVGAAAVNLQWVRALYLPTDEQTADELRERCEQLIGDPGGAEDVLVLRGEGSKLLVVSGAVESITDARLAFVWKGERREVELAKLAALRPAAVGQGDEPEVRGTVFYANGSTVRFGKLRLMAEQFTAGLIGVGPTRTPRGRVAAIRFHSGRTTPLGRIEPSRVVEYGMFGDGFAHRVGRSVSGGPIVLGARSYEAGLGLHSFCELTYRLDRKYSRFVAAVGIDDAVRPRGSAELTLLGDGEELTDPLVLTGRDEPVILRVDVSQVSELVIRVGFGPDDLDVSDHVDLAAARLIE